MKQLITIALCATALLAATADDVKIATREWVTNYVARSIFASRAELAANATVTTTNGVTVVEAGSGTNAVRLVWQHPTDKALATTNCTASAIAQGITNGCLFVWNGTGTYVNPHGTITATPTNLVFSGVSSVSTNGVERFAGWFDARGVLIQPGTSLATTNGMEEVQL